MLACMTGLRRWVPLINLDQGSSVPLGFVFELTDKLTPSDITDGFCKAVVLDHVLDSQAFHANHLVFVYDACTELVLIVPSPISDPGMDLSNSQAGFVAVLGALLFPGMPTLRLGKPSLILGKMARVANLFSGREGHHGLNAKIETDHCVDHWQGFDVILHQDRDEVAVRTIFGDSNRARFGILGKISMPMDIQGSIHFCQGQCSSIPLESVGGISSRLAILLFLKCGVFGASLKEVLECSIQVPQRLLNGHTRNISQPKIVFLEVR